MDFLAWFMGTLFIVSMIFHFIVLIPSAYKSIIVLGVITIILWSFCVGFLSSQSK